MKARVTLRPGQRGTKKLVERFGARLLCVRYRYDPVKLRRVTTVELVVDEAPWRPAAREPVPPPTVGVRIRFEEQDLRQRVKAAGGRWDGGAQVWFLPLDQVRALGLEARVAQK